MGLLVRNTACPLRPRLGEGLHSLHPIPDPKGSGTAAGHPPGDFRPRTDPGEPAAGTCPVGREYPARKNAVALEHHLTELKVILIRRIISDQLAYINIAKKWFG